MSETNVGTIPMPQDKEEFERGYNDGLEAAQATKRDAAIVSSSHEGSGRTFFKKGDSAAYLEGFAKGLETG